MNISALIFDFDGTILDTETPIFEEWREEYRRHGLPLAIETWGQSLGTHGSIDFAVELARSVGLQDDPETLRDTVRARILERLEDQPLQPGVVELLNQAEQLDLPLAVASSSSSGWVENWLVRHEIRPRFGPICGRDHVERVKPAPDLFLLAAERLGAQPSQCLVIEDSPNGVRAAHDAGMRCVAVTNPITRQLEMPEVEMLVETLEGLDLAAFGRGAAGSVAG